ncbi:unnamed protein product [Thelazia callipaeda]|uniref:Uncharacterized protein n=1 Tax=Thelazia callipaeda TaxID=103827 RepID=A0A0N5CK92_THECL|nr:unnamed protein product [Thelazia callipaeda]
MFINFSTILAFICFLNAKCRAQPQPSQFCINDAQCGLHQRCAPNTAGLLLCQPFFNHISNNRQKVSNYLRVLKHGQTACQSDHDCAGFGKCIRNNWYSTCQYDSFGWKALGAVNDICYENADCSEYLDCVKQRSDTFSSCQINPEKFPYKACQNDNDCIMLEKCSFSKLYNQNLCLTLSPYSTRTTISPFWNQEIGKGVIVMPTDSIGHGAYPRHFDKECNADYQAGTISFIIFSHAINIAFINDDSLAELFQPLNFEDFDCSSGKHYSLLIADFSLY